MPHVAPIRPVQCLNMLQMALAKTGARSWSHATSVPVLQSLPLLPPTQAPPPFHRREMRALAVSVQLGSLLRGRGGRSWWGKSHPRPPAHRLRLLRPPARCICAYERKVAFSQPLTRDHAAQPHLWVRGVAWTAGDKTSILCSRRRRTTSGLRRSRRIQCVGRARGAICRGNAHTRAALRPRPSSSPTAHSGRVRRILCIVRSRKSAAMALSRGR